jgi:outer membrane immunogenic protein
MNTQKYLLPFALCLAGIAHHNLAVASGSGINPFQGFYGQIATGYESNSFSNTTTRYTNVSPIEIYSTGTNVAANQTATGMPLVLGLGYNFSLNEKWVLGVGADYSFLSQTTGKFTARNPSFPGSYPAVGQQIEASNRVNVFLTAGYALTQNDLLYAKAGYSNQQVQFSRPAQDSSTGYALKSNQSGYVLGLGYRKTIQGGLYIFAEANYMAYSSASMNGQLTTNAGSEIVTTQINQKPSASAFTALFGLGYRF